MHSGSLTGMHAIKQSSGVGGSGTIGGRSVISTVSRVYAYVLSDRGSEFWDHDNFVVENCDEADDYALIGKVGRGKYSEVFRAERVADKLPVIIKILKPVKRRKVRREIKILTELTGGVNIIRLLGVVPATGLQNTALIFEQLDNKDFKAIYFTLSEPEIRYYIYQVLKALNYCHSKGIMHRDIKPHNIIVDQRQRKLRLIDWGLAEFYRPGEDYNVRVASRFFKGPELLVDYGYYDYSLDMWSLGCMFAAMIFRREPFFNGSDNTDQLVKICKVLGTAELWAYLKKYNVVLDRSLREAVGNHMPRKWERFIKTENEYLVTDDALDLLDKLLRFDHMERLAAMEAMQHAYFGVVAASEGSGGSVAPSTGGRMISRCTSGNNNQSNSGGSGGMMMYHSDQNVSSTMP